MAPFAAGRGETSACVATKSCAIVLPPPQTMVIPRWPGSPFKLACPERTSQETCDRLGSFARCFEPEPETEEVVNALLTYCADCLYVDVGCNVGYFTMQAAMHGALVECFEPTPYYTAAIERSARLNDVHTRVRVHNVGMVPTEKYRSKFVVNGKLSMTRTYHACGVGLNDHQHLINYKKHTIWSVPIKPIREVLLGRRVTLLKMDIDSLEGLLLQTVADMVERNETTVDSILVEIGDSHTSTLEGCTGIQCNNATRIRGSDLSLVWRLIHTLNYDAYRVNTHVNKEIFTWTGANINAKMNPTNPFVVPMLNLRGIRKLELLPRTTPLSEYGMLFRWGVSYLFTRVPLAEPAKHHSTDMKVAELKGFDLNAGSPLLLNSTRSTREVYAVDRASRTVSLRRREGQPTR